MTTTFLGKSGLRISSFGFGTMSFGGDADEATSRALYDRAREAGINLFDCADVYAGGASERILGRFIADHRDDVVITTKAYFPTGDGPNDRGSSRYHLTRAVESSLQRLNTDHIDVFFLHRFDDATPLEETLRTLDDLVHAGKIAYLGASNFAAWQVSKALGLQATHDWAALACIQPMYNLVKRQAEVEIFPMAAAEGLGVIPYSPLGGGLLTGKYGTDRRPDTGRLIDNPMYGVRYGHPSVYDAADRFCQLAAKYGHSPVALAIAWVAHHPAVTAPLLGARNLQQLEGALEASNVEMTPALYQEIAALTPTPPPATDRNEEASAHNYGSR